MTDEIERLRAENAHQEAIIKSQIAGILRGNEEIKRLRAELEEEKRQREFDKEAYWDVR